MITELFAVQNWDGLKSNNHGIMLNITLLILLRLLSTRSYFRINFEPNLTWSDILLLISVRLPDVFWALRRSMSHSRMRSSCFWYSATNGSVLSVVTSSTLLLTGIRPVSRTTHHKTDEIIDIWTMNIRIVLSVRIFWGGQQIFTAGKVLVTSGASDTFGHSRRTQEIAIFLLVVVWEPGM